ncbi:MAG: FHA domain-containing protein [Candidatus Dadabacteria bacterium]|nr:MAG: FHA domain-containing protein [Candidatus Dadabacteria bacterium]
MSKKNGNDRLIGWLVSYQLDKMGKAYELRSGRSFIASRPVENEPTISIDEQDIDTPHLALSASKNHKLMAQDIFSSGGSYLKRCQSDEEVQLGSPVQLKHGDWIRIGEKIRFQVCLINGAGK